MYLTKEPIDLASFIQAAEENAGALVLFTGVVRPLDRGRKVERLFYEAYDPMVERMMSRLISEAGGRWPLLSARVLHRTGDVGIGEIAVAIAVYSEHRDEAFRACRFLIDEIKHRVPIWKKQFFEDGSSEWVLCSHLLETVSP